MIAPALRAWLAEVATGRRHLLRLDALWRAACAETNAIEFTRDRLPKIAATFMEEAKRIVASARKEGVA
jgi:hypothetical protein